MVHDLKRYCDRPILVEVQNLEIFIRSKYNIRNSWAKIPAGISPAFKAAWRMLTSEMGEILKFIFCRQI